MTQLTQNRLLNGLMIWTHEGGPWFPPKEVRELALKTCGELFPNGHSTRKFVNLVFKTVHPWNLFR